MWTAVLTAFALLLVMEGLPLLLAPARWREVMRRIADLADGQLRFFGLVLVAVGLGFLLFTGRS